MDVSYDESCSSAISWNSSLSHGSPHLGQKTTAAFRQKGCEALTGKKCVEDDSLRSQAAGVVFELLGDDMDGAAALLDDFEFLGMLDE